jgi:hypothetical protein
MTPKRHGPESWPLPDTDADEKRRPSTSDGVISNTGGLGSGNGRARMNTDSTANTEKGNAAVLGRTGKKKRFPMLRKAFGLKD